MFHGRRCSLYTHALQNHLACISLDSNLHWHGANSAKHWATNVKVVFKSFKCSLLKYRHCKGESLDRAAIDIKSLFHVQFTLWIKKTNNLFIDVWCGINRGYQLSCVQKNKRLFAAQQGKILMQFHNRKDQIRTLEPNLTWWTSGCSCSTRRTENSAEQIKLEISKRCWRCQIKHREVSAWEPRWQEPPNVCLHRFFFWSNWGLLFKSYAHTLGFHFNSIRKVT